MTAQLIHCPRCGESLPVGTTRCDGCGAYLVPAPAAPTRGPGHEAPHGAGSARARGGAPPAKGKRPADSRVIPGIAYVLLTAGLVVGGLIGYTLRGSIGPHDESGAAPAGPADLMAGGTGAPGAAMGGGGGAMPADVMQKVQEYHAALQRDPNDLQAHIGLGNLLFDSSQWEKAIAHYTSALERDPKNGDVRVDRAIAYHNLGQDTQAVADMERVTRENPTHKNAWLNLGVVTAAMGDRKTAIRAWERYLALEPSGERSDQIREELARIKQP